jgi:hypothetical protein
VLSSGAAGIAKPAIRGREVYAQNGSLIEIARRLAEKLFNPPLIQNQFRSALRRSDPYLEPTVGATLVMVGAVGISSAASALKIGSK